MLHLSNNLKEKKRKRKEILNNDLAILPSHDIHYLTHKLPFNGQPLIQQTEKGIQRFESLEFPLSSVRISCVVGLTNWMMVSLLTVISLRN